LKEASLIYKLFINKNLLSSYLSKQHVASSFSPTPYCTSRRKTHSKSHFLQSLDSLYTYKPLTKGTNSQKETWVECLKSCLGSINYNGGNLYEAQESWGEEKIDTYKIDLSKNRRKKIECLGEQEVLREATTWPLQR